MAKYWMISNRSLVKGKPCGSDRGDVSYWTSDQAPLDREENWTKASWNAFKASLVAAADAFPAGDPANSESQSHVTLFVHGYNNGWQEAAKRYQGLCNDLFSGSDGLGVCVSYDWPSLGSVAGYLPDREHARACATDLADVLSELYDWLLKKQAAAALDIDKACKAKVSCIAHSMGNFVLQKAMAAAWSRKNQPLLASLLNQLIMVAADIDNDLFEPRTDDAFDGSALANLTYRATALYSGRDAVLGASAGMKHFGTRRLGRSGLAVRPPSAADNIWDVDCSSFFPQAVSGMGIHSAYFETRETITLMRDVLRGIDRKVLESLGRTSGDRWPPR
jgi:esterase/lipase superfamily enzyme